ncbi:MAG TPA: thiamine pyrophosphate-dependent enzyme [Gemmatimonadaceae bacterium]|nr:thiamine pyrophosphate-dependent enzyme [Gemmatimonadaceae bacterium]
MPTVADFLVRALVDHDLRTLYCLPGIQLDPFFNAVFDAHGALRAVHTRHEQGAAYMALGAALATGRPSAYAVVPGPGVLNTTAALATAYATSARVLCLSGEIPSRLIDQGFGMLHEIPDQVGILRHLTKWAGRIDRPDDAASLTEGTFRALFGGRPRPVALEVPPDVLGAPMPDVPGNARGTTRSPLDEAHAAPALDHDAIREAARMLASSRRPLIVVGGGALDASDDVRRLAERLQAPVVAYRMGRGVLDDRHPLSLTVPGGHRLWRDADVVLAIGTRLQMARMNWGTDDALRVIRVEIDPQEVDRIRKPAIGLVGPAEAILPALAEELERMGSVRESRTDELRSLKADVARELAVLEPQLSYLRAIRDALPEEGVLVDDLTQMSYVARLAFPVYAARTYVTSGYQGTLGSGYATALGAQDARRDVPVVSISGDGGFMYTMAELATAVRHAIPVVAVVFNDGAFGNVRRMQQEKHGNRVVATDLTNPDFVRLAESFGVTGVRAEGPTALRSALERAIAAREPALIEVPVGVMPDPFPFFNYLPRVRGEGS